MLWAYDAANRLATPDGQARFDWDANGNLLADGDTQYAYGPANRPITATVSGVTSTMAYNGDGERPQQVASGTVPTYTLDLAAPLVQVLVAYAPLTPTHYLYGVARIGEEQGSLWGYHLTDGLGSVRQLANASGIVTLARGYMPYGEEWWSAGEASSAFGFAGEQADAGTGLVYLRARYYSVHGARFLTADDVAPDLTTPLSLNLYAYAYDDPVNHVDPTGHCVRVNGVRDPADAQCWNEYDRARSWIWQFHLEEPQDLEQASYPFLLQYNHWVPAGARFVNAPNAADTWDWNSIVPVVDSLDDIEAVFGGDQTQMMRIIARNGTIKFIMSGTSCGPLDAACAPGNGVEIPRKSSLPNKQRIVHEVGHVADYNLARIHRTGTDYWSLVGLIGHGWAFCYQNYHTEQSPYVYDPATGTAAYSQSNPKEDFADSFVALVLGEQVVSTDPAHHYEVTQARNDLLCAAMGIAACPQDPTP